MDNFFNNIWCLIIPLIAILLGWLFRHWTCKKCDYSDLEKEIENLRSKNAKLQADLDTCLANNKNDDLSKELENLRSKNASLQAEYDTCFAKRKKVESELDICLASKANIASTTASSNLGISSTPSSEATEPTLVFDASAAKLALGKKIIADDLKIVEGIGPKIAELFNNNGISTWYQLSKASVERCQEVLNTGGKRYEIHNPGTWPKQSGLAFEGKWKELNDLQDYLDGGVDRG